MDAEKVELGQTGNLNGSLAPYSALPTCEQKTGFLSLSAELRNRVYELVIVYGRPLHGRNAELQSPDIRLDDPPEVSSRHGIDPKEQPALTRVCRQIRDESLPVYYGRNRFACFGNETLLDRALSLMSKGVPVDKVSRLMRNEPFLGAEAATWFRAIGQRNTGFIREFDMEFVVGGAFYLAMKSRMADLPRVMTDYFQRIGVVLPSRATISVWSTRLSGITSALLETKMIVLPWVQADDA